MVDFILVNDHQWLAGAKTILSGLHSNSDREHLLLEFVSPFVTEILQTK